MERICQKGEFGYSVSEVWRRRHVSCSAILQLSYWYIRNKEEAVKKIAKHLGIEKYNVQEVIENSSVEKTKELRKMKFENANRPFLEAICYRKGKNTSWKEELSIETQNLFKITYPDLD